MVVKKRELQLEFKLDCLSGWKRDCSCAGTNATEVWRRKVIGGYPVPCK